jgi:hypothetical protein
VTEKIEVGMKATTVPESTNTAESTSTAAAPTSGRVYPQS